jgi:hypothetical protein
MYIHALHNHMQPIYNSYDDHMMILILMMINISKKIHNNYSSGINIAYDFHKYLQ